MKHLSLKNLRLPGAGTSLIGLALSNLPLGVPNGVWLTALFVGVVMFALSFFDTEKESQRLSLTMPLYIVVRWLAQYSQWAADFPAHLDNHWIEEADSELQSALTTGRLRAWGFYKPRFEPAENALSEIPQDFWRKAQWNSHHMVHKEPPSHIWRNTQDGGGAYRRVVFDPNEVKTLWPKRSLVAGLRKQSPIERLDPSRGEGGYQQLWSEQDAYYSKLRGRPAYGPFSAAFDDAIASVPEDD